VSLAGRSRSRDLLALSAPITGEGWAAEVVTWSARLGGALTRPALLVGDLTRAAPFLAAVARSALCLDGSRD